MSAVAPTYDRIAQDPRHAAICCLGIREMRGRSFPEWSMGASMRTPQTEAIYARHGLDSVNLDPRLAASILALAMDLQDFMRSSRIEHGFLSGQTN